MNAVWKLDNEFIAAYTEDKEIMRRINRSYPSFSVMATYYKNAKRIGIQYKVPATKKRAALRIFC